MKLGPYNLHRPNVLHIRDFEIDLNKPIYHLWGENGVGKSTLLKLILNQCITQKIPFAFVDQNYRLSWMWWMSVRENLMMPLKNTKKNITSLNDLPEYQSQQSWLTQLIDTPAGYLDKIHLSGGQLQRLVMFRELLLKPRIVLLDEAFSALDIDVVRQQTQWLLDQQQTTGFQIISIAHDRRVLDCMPGVVMNLSLSSTKELECKYV